MYEFFTKLDPLQTLLVCAVVALYLDSRRDRQRYQASLFRITEIYQDTLRQTTEALTAMKAEVSFLAQAIAGLRRRAGHDE